MIKLRSTRKRRVGQTTSHLPGDSSFGSEQSLHSADSVNEEEVMPEKVRPLQYILTSNIIEYHQECKYKFT